MTTPRLFTIEEAEALLPRVRHELQLMREALAYLRRASAAVSPETDREGAGDRAVPPLHAAALQQLSDAQVRLGRQGVQVKDVDEGLVDFPALDADQPILLCWRDGEDGIAWFHDVSSGFSSRRPVSELKRAGKHRGPLA